MTSPAPVIAQPDIEAFLWSQIGGLSGVTSHEYAAAPIFPGWLVAHSLQVDCRAKRKQAARDLAETVRQIVVALPDAAWAEGVVATVDVLDGPFYQPDDDGLPRYVARYEIRAHPARPGVIPPAAAAAHPPRRKSASLAGSTAP
jgi:hypothetical protein